MARRLLGPLATGALGCAILIGLGVWQLQRLAWKEAILAEIDARMAAAPTPLPADAGPDRDAFRPVAAEGTIGGEAFRVVWTDDGGAAFRIVSPFATGGRTILLDRGIVPADAAVPGPPRGSVTVVGNLHWPDEQDGFTPPPDIDDGLWYARDVAAMAAELGAEPLLLVAREVPGDAVAPRPIDTAGIPNDHLEYALTWFALAAVWAGMTAALVWRIRRRFG
jgi:surfeit locus 1 family protein